MVPVVLPLLAYTRTFFLTRHSLALEIAALGQQLAVLKCKQPRPPSETWTDSLDSSPPFLVFLVIRPDRGQAGNGGLLAPGFDDRQLVSAEQDLKNEQAQTA